MALFTDDYENVFVPWTGTNTQVGNTLETLNVIKRCNSWAEHVIISAWNNRAFAYWDLPNPTLTAYARSYSRYENNPDNNKYILLLDLLSTQTRILAGIGVMNDAGTMKYCFMYTDAGVEIVEVIANPVPSISTFKCLKVKTVVNNGAGEARGYVEGVEVFTHVGLNNILDPRILRIESGINRSNSGNPIEGYNDCVVCDTADINCLLAAPKGSIALHAKVAGIL